MTRYFLPLLAVAGIVFAIFVVRTNQAAPPVAQPVASPPTSAFQSQIAGAGLVEASSENIAIGTIVPGVVNEVYVRVGQKVKKGEKLFSIEVRDLEALLQSREAAVAASKERLTKLKQGARPEDLPPLEAKVLEAEAVLADRQDQLKRLSEITQSSGGAVSKDEYNRAVYAVEVAKAQLNGAQSQLAVVKAGTWQPDIKIAEADLASAQAEVDALKTEWTRRTVLSPIDGTLLQVKMRAGEFAQTGVLATPLMLLGNTDIMHLRVDIDENDAWRLKTGAKAVCSLRGNSTLKTDLAFVNVEPYVTPKRSLTGESTERVDTRVLQVIYRLENPNFPVYVGQQMDVSIDAGEATP
ncbi:MAG TPA: biotin/lipoyl-binding protein [Tepidisphaeraceae bacterium]